MSGRRAPLADALRDLGRRERRRALAWLLAGALLVVPVLLVAGPGGAAFVLGLTAALLVVTSLRAVVGVQLAVRDAAGSGPPPRRATVLLLRDPNPRAWRPLLAVWHGEHREGDRWRRPDGVWRADAGADDLESPQDEPVVHEAWVDAGRWSWSPPRWVLADAGLALGHRWSVLGRWYVGRALRSSPPDARPLTVDHRLPSVRVPRPEGTGMLVLSVLWRAVLLGLVVGLGLLARA